MAKHKAAAEVTVAPLFEKSAFEKAFDKYKAPAAAIVVAVVVWVLWSVISQQKSREKLDQSWEALIQGTTPDMYTRLPSASPEALAGLAASLKDRESGPWARLLEIQKRLEGRDYDGALAAIASLRTEHPSHLIVTQTFESEGETSTLLDRLQRAAQERKGWEASRPELFANPPAPEGSPRVRLVTSLGVIELALHAELAPNHVENFLKHCREGFYDKTRFHRISKGFMIQGGDPNSRDKEPAEWGQGGPGYTLPAEPNKLSHFAGVLSTAKKDGDKEENGSQFFLTTEPALHLDGRHTVFGQVMAGMDVVRKISEAPVAPEGARDRPVDPVAIDSVEIVP